MLKAFLKWIKRLAFIVWIFFMVLLGVKLVIDNNVSVSLLFFGFGLPEANLGLTLSIVLFLGVLMGFLTNYLAIKPGLMANARALKKAQKEVSKLKSQDQGPTP